MHATGIYADTHPNGALTGTALVRGARVAATGLLQAALTIALLVATSAVTWYAVQALPAAHDALMDALRWIESTFWAGLEAFRTSAWGR